MIKVVKEDMISPNFRKIGRRSIKYSDNIDNYMGQVENYAYQLGAREFFEIVPRIDRQLTTGYSPFTKENADIFRYDLIDRGYYVANVYPDPDYTDKYCVIFVD